MLSFNEYIAAVKQEINEIEVNSLQQELDKFTLIIDVREPEETKRGIIAGAVTIPRGLLESKLSSLTPSTKSVEAGSWLRQQRIALYCRSGARSALAAKSLQAMGLDKVYSLKGGFKAWCENSLPVNS